MSIIYEALKKIEKTKESQSQVLPSKHTIKVIVLLISAGITILSLSTIFRFFSSNNIKTNVNMESKVSSLPENIEDKTKDSVSLKREDRKDLLQEKREDKITVYHLQGIIYDEESPLAVINGKKVTIGAEIGGARLLSISPEGAELETKDGKIYISLE
jgi:hypothetical protein